MALNASISLSSNSIVPPQATQALLTVYNPGAVAVSVTNVELQVTPLGSTSRATSVPSAVVPMGPGVTTSVPALSSITIGPFPIVAPNLGAGAPIYQLITQTSNVQGSQAPQQTISVGALVYGSDGSVNQASPAAFLVSYTVAPVIGTEGGVYHFASSSNSLGVIPGWP